MANSSRPAEIKAIALVSNSIACGMLHNALVRDGHDPAEVAVIAQRPISAPWLQDCGILVDFPTAPSLNKLSQLRLIPYYVRASRIVRELLSTKAIVDVYISNVDNIISNHIVNRASKSMNPPGISVIAEGLMNYQDITDKDRPTWRWRVKPFMAFLLGLDYKIPKGHLSGSYEDAVSRVFSYSATGLKAPIDKFRLAEFPRIEARVAPDPNAALVVMTGIGQWMAPEKFEMFKQAFVRWINQQGFATVYIKRHPFYPSGGIELLIDNAVIVEDKRRLEDMADELPARHVIGYCSTGVIILKLIRPDLVYTDWGSNFYCEHAYHGDRSVVDVMRGTDIEIVEMSSSEIDAPTERMTN